VPQRNIALGALAALANPLRGAVQPGLEATAYFGPAKGATAAGAHAMIVEVDPATMDLHILKYVVVHDCGTVINPLIVAGQIQGGVAQGIGNAFYERLAFNEQGQLINGTPADYLLPIASEVPRIDILHHVTPSPYNELGVKGVGEAGAIPVGALFAQAIEDALELPARGIDILEIPLDPGHLLGACRTGGLTDLGRSTTWPADSGYAMSWLSRPGQQHAELFDPLLIVR
jgi:CO/xanthine dehydrogenase Mo-binding subunit